MLIVVVDLDVEALSESFNVEAVILTVEVAREVG